MYRLNSLLFFVFMVFLSGCSPKYIPFDTNNFSERSFYQGMTDILKRDILIDSAIIYQTTFAEKPYEGYYVIDYSEVNAQNDKNILHYKAFKGNYQKLFLLKLITVPRDSITIYFSLKYNAFDECMGFGPAYMGWIDENKKIIYFNAELYTRHKKNVFGLKKRNLPLALYMTANEMDPGRVINIEKMIVEKSFEIGNNVVIDIPRIFRDSFALRFQYLDREKIK
jgi:hypothetical protein